MENNKKNHIVVEKDINIYIPKTVKNMEYNQQSLIDLLKEFEVFGIYNKYTVNVEIFKKIAFDNDEAKGYISIARVKSIDIANNKATVVFSGPNVKFIDILDSKDNIVLMPIFRLDKNKNIVGITKFVFNDLGTECVG